MDFGRLFSSNAATSQASDHLIALSQVSKVYTSDAGEFTALRDVDLAIDAGEFVTVVGKSGSGKSTLLNMLSGIDHPTSGEVWVDGTAVHTLNENQMAAWRGQSLGIVFQFFQLLPTLTVVENILLPMDFAGYLPRRKRRGRALELLALVDLCEQADKLPSELSGGQQQRVAIARALANDPCILLADEPTGNLDSRTADDTFRLFEGLVEDGKTILMVTHDRDMAQRGTRTIRLADGAIVDGAMRASRDVADTVGRPDLKREVRYARV